MKKRTSSLISGGFGENMSPKFANLAAQGTDSHAKNAVSGRSGDARNNVVTTAPAKAHGKLALPGYLD
jgi:hypothetical protein